jgi:DNA polymerase III delta subunit
MPKPVYALVGSDAFLQLEALANLLRETGADVQRVDADGETAQLADVLDELRSFAMFGGGKLVVVRNADAFLTKFRESLEDYVAAPSNSAILVLRLSSLPANQRIYKAIAKTGTIVACEPPKDLAKWITERGKSAHQILMNVEAARLLADLIGGDLGKLDNELAKLALTVSDPSPKNDRPAALVPVKPEDVAGSVVFQRERQMWDMTNALVAGDSADALRRWRQLVQGDSSAEFRAVTWLAIWLENVRKALAMLKQGQNAFTIGNALRIWPRDLQPKFVETAKAMGPRDLARAVDLLAQIDFQTKTGVGDAADNVERFLLTLAAGQRDLLAQRR